MNTILKVTVCQINIPVYDIVENRTNHFSVYRSIPQRTWRYNKPIVVDIWCMPRFIDNQL